MNYRTIISVSDYVGIALGGIIIGTAPAADSMASGLVQILAGALVLTIYIRKAIKRELGQ